MAKATRLEIYNEYVQVSRDEFEGYAGNNPEEKAALLLRYNSLLMFGVDSFHQLDWVKVTKRPTANIIRANVADTIIEDFVIEVNENRSGDLEAANNRDDARATQTRVRVVAEEVVEAGQTRVRVVTEEVVEVEVLEDVELIVEDNDVPVTESISDI